MVDTAFPIAPQTAAERPASASAPDGRAEDGDTFADLVNTPDAEDTQSGETAPAHDSKDDGADAPRKEPGDKDANTAEDTPSDDVDEPQSADTPAAETTPTTPTEPVVETPKAASIALEIAAVVTEGSAPSTIVPSEQANAAANVSATTAPNPEIASQTKQPAAGATTATTAATTARPTVDPRAGNAGEPAALTADANTAQPVAASTFQHGAQANPAEDARPSTTPLTDAEATPDISPLGSATADLAAAQVAEATPALTPASNVTPESATSKAAATSQSPATAGGAGASTPQPTPAPIGPPQAAEPTAQPPQQTNTPTPSAPNTAASTPNAQAATANQAGATSPTAATAPNASTPAASRPNATRPNAPTLPDPVTPPGQLSNSADTSLDAGLDSLEGVAERASTASAAARSSAVGPRIDAAAIAALAAKFAKRASDGSTSFKVRLDPPELGRVDVRLTVDAQGQAQARLIVETPEAYQELGRNLRNLERALQDTDLNLADGGLHLDFSDGDANPFAEADDDPDTAPAASPAPTRASDDPNDPNASAEIDTNRGYAIVRPGRVDLTV